MEDPRAIEVNRQSWDRRTPIHLRSALYQAGLKKLREGGLTLLPPTEEEIGPVKGRKVLHLQCHIGLDTLSLARLGAEVTGLDFSPPALEAARGFADELGLKARFVCGDAQRADEVLAGETFDMVFASFGVFCWIPDLDRWMQSAGNLLKPEGVLYVADGHPMMDLLEDDSSKSYGFEFRYGYFDRGPMEFGPGPSYADDGQGSDMGPTVEYSWTMGDLVSKTAGAGFRIQYLHEFPGCFFQRLGVLQEQSPGIWDFPDSLRGKIPGVFSLRGVRD